MSTSEFDCTACGACCFGAHPRYIALLPEDRARALPETAVAEIEGRRYLRLHESHCAQLGATADGRLVCAVYAARPEACRAFRAGSFECRMAVRHNGAPAAALRAPAPALPVPAILPDLPGPEVLPPML